MHASKLRDLTKGSVPKNLLLFVAPIMLGNVLQTLYSAADKIVVGQFASNGKLALAAVEGTTAISYLLLGLFLGLGIGVNVICANLLGARKQTELRRTMHTAIPVALICGVLVGLAGFLAADGVLRLMGTPENVHELSKLYMRLYFVGVPSMILYNFGSAILRSFGDTKRPMYILMVSGLVNVLLNLVFVLGFDMSVGGVAIATMISQTLSALLVLRILFDPKDQYKMQVKELHIHTKELMSIVRIGIPSGLGGMMFSGSNVVIQSSLNAFNDAALLAGKAVVSDVTGMIYQVLAAMLSACVSFAGQCYGAKKYKRIDQLALWGCVICWIIMGLMIAVCVFFAEQVIGLFNSDPDVIRKGAPLLRMVSAGYLIYVPSEVFMGCSRGMKHAGMPTILNFLGICVTRIIWVFAIFPANPTAMMLYLCYPVSWLISAALQGSYYLHTRIKVNRQEAV